MKPNSSLLSRELQVDRRTVKKYYNGFTKPKIKSKKSIHYIQLFKNYWVTTPYKHFITKLIYGVI